MPMPKYFDFMICEYLLSNNSIFYLLFLGLILFAVKILLSFEWRKEKRIFSTN